MAMLTRLVGEGIGPFKSFDFDFSDGKGNPHPGPHIFAGVNGSGKSTVLRTLAWLFASGLAGGDHSSGSRSEKDGFHWKEWQHFTRGYSVSRAKGSLASVYGRLPDIARTADTSSDAKERLLLWVLEDSPRPGNVDDLLTAAYGPSLLLKHLPQVNLSSRIEHFKENALSFEATIQNEIIQSWLLNLVSKRAIAKDQGKDVTRYLKYQKCFETALTLICGQEIKFTVDIEPAWVQPILLMYGKRLNFSQLPDGLRSTVGWLADFLMRMDVYDQWVAKESLPIDETGRILLLDEVDAHLHPRWQRRILPSIKQSLPDVQVFATTHSPFVIASCSSARIHVLEVDNNGVARNRPAVDAPVGESILATLKDIFGVSSRFDLETEELLDEWNELDRGQAVGSLSPKKKQRMAELTRDLSSRSEELRQIVSPVVSIDDALLASLKSQAEKSESPRKRKAKRG
jgi:AAA domain, putative AbiEii toxin, Type IV TA system/AAA domain